MLLIPQPIILTLAGRDFNHISHDCPWASYCNSCYPLEIWVNNNNGFSQGPCLSQGRKLFHHVFNPGLREAAGCLKKLAHWVFVPLRRESPMTMIHLSSTYSPPPQALSLSGGAPLPGHTSHSCALCCHII